MENIENIEGGRLAPWELKKIMINWFSYERSKNLQRLSEKYALGWPIGWELEAFSDPPEDILTSFFMAYILDCTDRFIILKDNKEEKEGEGYLKIPYSFRGCKSYIGKQIGKFERLKDWIVEEDRKFLHLTFSPQSTRFSSILECLEKMKENRNTLLQYLRDRGTENLEYIWVMEPHESGFPHFHVLVFAPWIPKIQKLGDWWEKKGLGEYNGVDWEGPYDPQRSNKLVGYLTKYVSKTFGKKALGEKYEEAIKPGDGLTDFPELKGGNKKLLFWGALLWITRSRSYSCSEGVSEAMKNPNNDGGVELWACKGLIISRYRFLGSVPKADLEVVDEVFGGVYEDYFSSLGYG